MATKYLVIQGTANNSEEAIALCGEALHEAGVVGEDFATACVEREKNFPTGLDIDGMGVAIPHTDVSHVNRPAIAIAVLKNPVTFIQMGTDDEEVGVKLVFMLAVTDPSAHIDELQRIIEIIQDKAVLEKLFETTDKEKIIEIIREKENTL